MLRIRILTPTDPEEVREFGHAERVRFGRDPHCDLCLDSTYVSRSHGELVRDAGGWSVTHWGSRTPLERLRGDAREELPPNRPCDVRDGDVIQILHTRLVLEITPWEEQSIGLPFLLDGAPLETADVYDAGGTNASGRFEPARGRAVLHREARGGRLDPELIALWLESLDAAGP